MKRNRKKETFNELIISFFALTLGACLAAIALANFLVPSLILDGGINGISIILGILTNVPISIFIALINIPFLLLGIKQLGKKFFLKSLYSMVAFAILLYIFETIPALTYDSILASVFGGIVLGIGVGIVIRFGGVLDGTEIVGILISKNSNFSLGQVILFFNIIIYTVAGFLFGWDRALYSILTYLITFKIIDFVADGLEQTKSAMIITENAPEIAQKLLTVMGRTATILEGVGMISGEKTILYCVITRLEVQELKDLTLESDPKAFVTISDVSEVFGRHVKVDPKQVTPEQKEKVKKNVRRIKKK